VRRLLITAAVASLVALTPAAADAKRSVPRQFAGVTLDGGADGDPAAVIDRQMALMARSGVESVRIAFAWSAIQPEREGALDFSLPDRQVATAARHGLSVLPVMQYAPRWAQALPSRGPGSPPLTKPFQASLRLSIRRYGSKGTFWRDNPSVPRRPLRYWQVWNEPHFAGFWNAPKKSRYAWPGGYARLLKASNSTIHRADRRARTVTAGLFGEPWLHLRRLYRSGGRRSFDVVAAHVYTRKEANVLETVRRVNREMTRSRDPGNRVWITEFSFPASKGRAKPIGSQGQETRAGMARRLYRTYLLLARNRKRERLDRAYWYTWASSYKKQQPSNFDFGGLLARSDPFSYKPQPALDAFRRMARRIEGCAKDSAARCR